MELTHDQIISLWTLGAVAILAFSNIYCRISDNVTISVGDPDKITGGEKLRFAYQFPQWRPFINIKVRM
ncbi:hypothetical protein [Photobacterium nomapromontoriensis]|uniref:hypothetical protein n=1 Tax=Photobacterium nomapromontoriensis TaxID=2910237 RepID=UPI003D0FFD43